MAARNLRLATKLQPTPFHQFMNELAVEGRLHRHYTQNIDCIDTKLEPLDEKTVRLHGRLDQVICSKCADVSPIDPEKYMDIVGTKCPKCAVEQRRRILEGKRRASSIVGAYQPHIVLYGGDNPNESLIMDQFGEDLHAPVDALLIVGTRMTIPSVRKFTRQMCRKIKDRKGVVIWISLERPGSVCRGLERSFDYIIEGDCNGCVT